MDDDSEQTFRKYEEELEINDFPQQARWRVTSKVRVYISIEEYCNIETIKFTVIFFV